LASPVSWAPTSAALNITRYSITSAIEDMAYAWDSFETYRLSYTSLENFLTEKFGAWDFKIRVSKSWHINSPTVEPYAGCERDVSILEREKAHQCKGHFVVLMTIRPSFIIDDIRKKERLWLIDDTLTIEHIRDSNNL
jgi:hypothetical protein